MTARLDRERAELRDVVASFLGRTQDMTAVRHALEQGYDRSVWARMAGELGLTAVGLPEEVGGTGESVSDLIVVTEELGRQLDPGPFVPSVVLGARVLLAAGADSEWTERVIDGSSTISVALPGHHGPHGRKHDPVSVRVDGDCVLVDGTVRDVLHGDSVDDLVVVADTDGGPTLLRIATDAPGVTVTAIASVDLTRPLADVVFDGAPAELLGRPGAAEHVMMPVVRSARIAVAAELVGVAQGALDLTVAHALHRQQFGRAIGSFQAIKHALVDVMMDVEACRTAVRRAAEAVDAYDPEAEQLSLLCQAVSSDAAMQAGKAAIQVHGAIGFTWEHDAHLYLKRAMSGAQLFGSARENRRRLAGLLLDQKTTRVADPATPGRK